MKWIKILWIGLIVSKFIGKKEWTVEVVFHGFFLNLIIRFYVFFSSFVILLIIKDWNDSASDQKGVFFSLSLSLNSFLFRDGIEC